jgi:hypothetical protein
MEEYREKIANLSLERLEGLAKVYERTIHSYEATIREAKVVGMIGVVEYNQKELDKKKAELTVIQEFIDRSRAGK